MVLARWSLHSATHAHTNKILCVFTLASTRRRCGSWSGIADETRSDERMRAVCIEQYLSIHVDMCAHPYSAGVLRGSRMSLAILCTRHITVPLPSSAAMACMCIGAAYVLARLGVLVMLWPKLMERKRLWFHGGMPNHNLYAFAPSLALVPFACAVSVHCGKHNFIRDVTIATTTAPKHELNAPE